MMNAELNPESTPDGIKTGNRVIGYSAAIRQLDSGYYDKKISEGLRTLACIQDAKVNGWLSLSIEKEVIIWRWLVVTVFINEEREKNGTAEILNDEGGSDLAVIYIGKNGGISIYPSPLRFSLANHVEGCAIEKYGTEAGMALALRMYQDMVVVCQEQGFKLSAMGREGLEMLHDEFIEMIKTEGIPDMPVVH
ncbi:TPA: hypothetical protein U6245_003960 [Yersinia enterocolitica]|nr:hypothetical protein [Yersinia enterocolitica]EKN4012617.1 hypothetical protein [Yersinia enterocolitica]EKN4831645.1 hypothetical protein [Yersinia enterocolitica]ELI8046904.1 hypothetical protein [Yersinia enterocolitica]ELI8444653.1 hypothetical protein [Yersinia enterocolitica]